MVITQLDPNVLTTLSLWDVGSPCLYSKPEESWCAAGGNCRSETEGGIKYPAQVTMFPHRSTTVLKVALRIFLVDGWQHPGCFLEKLGNKQHMRWLGENRGCSLCKKEKSSAAPTICKTVCSVRCPFDEGESNFAVVMSCDLFNGDYAKWI